MSKQCIPPIEKDGVRLRLLEKTDLEITLSWRNENRRWFLNSDLLSIETHRSWFEQYIVRDDDFVFVIERLSEEIQPFGQISLYRIDWGKRTAEFGRLVIDERFRKKGIARRATEIILEYARNVLGIKKIFLEVLQNNFPAVSLYQNCGFVQTGIQENRIVMVLDADCADDKDYPIV
jgi:RimJ/RimL family protein N-acetyltransferase